MDLKSLNVLKAVGVGLVFASLSAFLIGVFAPFMVVPVAVVLFVIGLMLGFLFTFNGASWLYGAGAFTLLMMGTGSLVGELAGLRWAWVIGFLLLGAFLALYLPHMPNFQRALLAVLVATCIGLMGGMLGYSGKLPTLFMVAFFAIGTWVALKVPERGAIILTAHCVLAMFMMGLGYAIAFYIQQAFFWVPILFAISMIVSLYTKPARARLLLLLLAPLVMLLGAGYIIGAAFGIELISVSFFLALGLVLDLGLYFASDSLILSASGARILDEAESPRCYGIVKALAGKAGVPPPRLGLVATEVPNLFTVGRSPSRAVIALTEGLLDRMSDGELEVLMAHEIFHIKERDMLPMTLAATVAYPIGKLAKPIIFDEGQGRNPLVWVLLIVAAPFVAFLLHLSTPRARERRADEGAAASTGKREVLAAVLERMEETADHKTIDVNPATEPLFAVNPFRGEWLVALFTTHPPAEERIGLLMKGVVKKTDREKAGEAGRQAPRQPAPQQAAPQQPGPAPQAPQNPASASTGQSNGAPAEG